MRIRFLSLLLAFACLATTSACTRDPGTDPPGGGDSGPSTLVDAGTPTGITLRVEPADRVEDVHGTPITIEYRAIERAVDGTETDVTSETTFSLSVPALGSFAGNVFTSGTELGGITAVRALRGTTTGSTTLTLRVERDIITSTAPADAASYFDGTPTAGREAEIVYPADGAMVPPNFSELEVHYRPNGATLFSLDITGGGVVFHIYFGCPESVGGGCIYTPDREVWEAITAGAAGATLSYVLRSVDGSGVIGATAPRSLTIAAESIGGGLYYWNAGAGQIERFEFGVRGAVAEPFLGRTQTGAGICVGCHVLSRDGTRIGVGTDFPTTSFQVFDVATRTRLFNRPSAGFFPTESNFASFSPDNTQIVTSMLAGLRFLDATTGEVLLEGIGGGASSMPDWSPDGNHIFFARHDAPAVLIPDAPGITDGRITRLDRSGDTWVVGPTLVSTPGQNNYYPAVSPDGNWVAYNHSPSNTSSMGGSTDDGSSTPVYDAELWMVSADGTGTPFQLTALSGMADSWPKWDPTEYQHDGHPLFWLSWSSRRAFGLRMAADERSQLWMAAFDPTAAARGEQPFSAPVRLPFQSLTTSNHIAQWVTHVERQTCETAADCGGEFCVDGYCYAEEPLG